ncbi:POTRA domain-containing protein [Seonamhaeicola sp. ML3]|uniref:POTRA domain-containing protein n=1 Tax=Seonamhaeicola sp. ML3 TaxID=2937786 RepID=UPI00200FA24C|nr:POTRA domain-containing protein [Seonamhaeicola sp. ML3]
MNTPQAFILMMFVFFFPEVFCQNLKLKIDGSTPSETLIIDSLNYSKYHKDYISLESEIDSTQKQLYKLGFIENELSGINKISDSLFHANFNLKTRFNNLLIYYDESVIQKTTLELVSNKVYDDYFEIKLSETENVLGFLNESTSAKGFPFSKLKLSEIEIDDTGILTAQLKIETSQEKRIINDIKIKGYNKFPEAFLKHYLKIKRSQTFDLADIKNKTQQLQNLRFTSEVKPPEVLFSKDSTTLYLYLKKEQNNSFDGFLGFGTNEETSRIQFDGYINLKLTNNLNFGESFKILYKSDENDQETFLVDLSMPYMFKSPIGLDLSMNLFRKDSTFTTINQSAKLNYQINARHKISSGILFEESNNLLSTNALISIQDYRKNFVSFSYEYTNVKKANLLFPIHSNVYLETNFGNRKESSNTSKQTVLRADLFKIFNLNHKNSLYIRGNGAIIDSDLHFENELLRFGGINSIRGFEENSLFASLYGLINTEYRFQLNNSIYLHSVIDAAYFENKTQNLNQKLFSYGFGFGILTKSGLFKLNYANGKRENEQFKLSNSKVHISLTTIF